MSKIYEEILPLLSEYQQEFLEIELSRGVEVYRERIDFIGLNNCERVLDAGGGIGQWALALSNTSDRVDVVDISSERLFVGRHLSEQSKIRNIYFKYGSLEKLPYSDDSFDAIICYSVFMFADGVSSIREFNRVLKPNGKLYVMVDLWRWYLDLILKGKMGLKQTLIFSMKKMLKNYPTFYTKASFTKLLSDHDFEIVRKGQDGQSYFGEDVKEIDPKLCFYETDPSMKERLWEVCALKR